MVSLAVSYNAMGILLKEKGKNFWYFPTVWWSLFCLVFCAFVENCFKLDYFETELQKPGEPVHQGNLAVYCLFSAALT